MRVRFLNPLRPALSPHSARALLLPENSIYRFGADQAHRFALSRRVATAVSHFGCPLCHQGLDRRAGSAPRSRRRWPLCQPAGGAGGHNLTAPSPSTRCPPTPAGDGVLKLARSACRGAHPPMASNVARNSLAERAPAKRCCVRGARVARDEADWRHRIAAPRTKIPSFWGSRWGVAGRARAERGWSAG